MSNFQIVLLASLGTIAVFAPMAYVLGKVFFRKRLGRSDKKAK